MVTVAHTSAHTHRRARTRQVAVTETPAVTQPTEHEPSRAASVLPVLLSFGVLLAFAVGAAYFGREIIAVLGSVAANF